MKVPSRLRRFSAEKNTAKCGSFPFKTHKELVSVQVEEDGRIMRKHEWRTIDNSATLSKMRASDYALENLLAIGSTKSLTPTLLSSDNVDSTLDTLDNISTDMAAAVAAQTASTADDNPAE